MLKSVRRASPMQGDCVVDPNSTVSQLTRRQLHLPPPTRLWNALVLKVKMDRTEWSSDQLVVLSILPT